MARIPGVAMSAGLIDGEPSNDEEKDYRRKVEGPVLSAASGFWTPGERLVLIAAGLLSAAAPWVWYRRTDRQT
jgi:hypothetical protein